MDENTVETLKRPLPEFYDTEDGLDRCFVCGDPRYTPRYSTDRFGFPIAFHECACSTIKQVPMPNEKFFEWFFNSETFFEVGQVAEGEIWGYSDYFAEERARIWTSRLRMRRLSRYFSSENPLDVLKIGPSTGTFLVECRKRGHRVHGCDVSATFAAAAKKLNDLDIDVGRFEKLDYPDDAFDRIMLLNVIENVPNQTEFLAAIRRTLKPGGYFIFNYVEMRGNLIASLQKENYFLVRPPVTYMFARSGIEQILDQLGFEIETTMLDLRIINTEKVTGLFRFKRLARLMRLLKLNRIVFPIWAYPSYIVVARLKEK